MTTPTDICNRALSAGATRTLIGSLEENSPAAIQCRLWYDNQRQGLLRTAPWAFARRMVKLSLLSTLTDSNSPYPYLFKYAYPADCQKFRYVLPAPVVSDQSLAVPVGDSFPGFARPSRNHRYLINLDVADNGVQTRTILSNVPNAIGVYTYDTTNPDVFDTLFESALTSSLAYHLIMPLSGNVGLMQAKAEAADKSILAARAADGNEALPTTDHTPDWIRTREIGSFGGNNGMGFDNWGQWNCTWDSMNWGM